MLATLGLVAKAWYLYGPSVDELRTIGARVAEVTQQAWTDYWQKSNIDSSLANDPRLPRTDTPPAPFVPAGAPIEPMSHPSAQAGATSLGSVQLAGGVPAEVVPANPPSSPWPTKTAESALVPIQTPAPTEDPRLPGMLERLTQLGARDQQLTAWGSRGELVRFSCSVPWANSPAYSRHFEAVAATGVAAVEQVAAEIAAWRGSQP
jgi:hypothetical protein